MTSYTKSCLKKNAGTFSKNSTTQENIKISRLKKKLSNLYKKGNFKPEIKPTIENLPDELNQLESKHTKGAKLHANINFTKNALKLISMYLKDNMQNQIISELYNDNKKSADDKKTKYSSNPNDILKSTKNNLNCHI